MLFILLFCLNYNIDAEGSQNIMINEVMFNPEVNDNYNEWIELYNPTNKSINVSGWSMADNSDEDFLKGDSEHGNGTTMIPPKEYAIIADHGTKIYENFTIPNNTIKLYVDDSAIGNGLGNSKDKLILRNNTGNIIDAIEWGEDYPDVPGSAAEIVDEGHSLSRHHEVDTNNSSNDFYDGVNITPGSKNKVVVTPSLDIDVFPIFIPKIQNNSDYSIPFAIKVNISNYNSYNNYQLKAYVVGIKSKSGYATQTWDGNIWQYSNYYTSSITTNEQGNWSDWVYLRFKKDYKDYQKNIIHNDSALLYVKIKKDNNTFETFKEIFLLDMDDCSSNGTTGGYTVGIAEFNDTFLQNKIIIIENCTGAYAGAYVTEYNGIDEGFISKPGYYKVASPVGSGYKIKILDYNGSLIHAISNVTVKQGSYGVDIQPIKSYYSIEKNEIIDIPLSVVNTGDFNDSIIITVDHITFGWDADLEKENIYLGSKEKQDINLRIKPCQQNGCKTGTVTVIATSEKDIGESDEITFQLEILAPDLTITNIKVYNENGENSTVFGEGEIVRIKAFLKNIGNENATNTDAVFYYDSMDNEHSIGSKNYDSISKYQKYPSVIWDTSSVTPGWHTILIVADKGDRIDELDESNNELSIKVYILNTYPSKEERNILMTELYYYTHPNLENEFIALYNPTDCDLNISGWYFTNTPLKIKSEQTKIVFPSGTTIAPFSCLHITQNAESYIGEIGERPDFEYKTDSDMDIPQMIVSKTFILSNKGEVIALKDNYNHTVDIVVYGEQSYTQIGWEGDFISGFGKGIILKRNFGPSGSPVDTNTSSDWVNERIYGIGQSDFPYVNIAFHGEIITFVSPDCSFDTIVREIQKANDSIFLNVYEFTNLFLCDEIILALRENVKVKILLEGAPIGGISDEEKFILNRIAAYGGNIRFIVNDQQNDVYARYRYNHAKYLVVDNKTVIVESCNWGNTGIPRDPDFGNREWGIVVKNVSVAEYFLNVFYDDWNPNRCDSYSIDKMNFYVEPGFFINKPIFRRVGKPDFESGKFVGNFSVIPVFSPDTSYKAVHKMIESADRCIYIEQLYVYRDWGDQVSPFVEHLVNKSKQGVEVKVILNYNPNYKSTNEKCSLTKEYLEENGIKVKFLYTNWSHFINVHNKGMIVDNRSVLVSSINWNENSVMSNREAGIIIEDEDVASYYAEVFFYDWNLKAPQDTEEKVESKVENDYENTIYITVIFTMTFAVIARDWRKRRWT